MRVLYNPTPEEAARAEVELSEAKSADVVLAIVRKYGIVRSVNGSAFSRIL